MKKEEWYIIKVKDKLTKNHWDLENIVSGVMPENKTDELLSNLSKSTLNT